MKTTFVILSFIISVQSFGQKWHLQNIDTTKKLGYEYWFQFENKEDTNTFNIFKEPGNQNLVVKLFNNKNDTVVFANVVITKRSTDSVTVLLSDYDGLVSIKLDTGNYKIEVYDQQYEKFELELDLEMNQSMTLDIKLGLAPQLGFYQINSKYELNEKEILEIINCVKKNRNNYFEKCSDTNQYIVMMQI